jgi:hypothetical protein
MHRPFTGARADSCGYAPIAPPFATFTRFAMQRASAMSETVTALVRCLSKPSFKKEKFPCLKFKTCWRASQ